MALDAGVMSLTIEFAQGLKDKDFFGKMDPYAIITVGSQTFRTKTVQSGGTNPVFNETFRFNIINENDFHIILKDEDVTSDEKIGTGRGDLAKARAQRTDRLQVPMMSKSGKQHGFVSISLSFAPNNANAGHPPAGHAPPQQYAPQAYGAPPPQYGAPPHGAYPPQQYAPPAYPPQPYGAPPHYPPQPYGAAPPQYPPQPYAAPPQYPPQPYGAPPQYPPRPY